MNRQGPRRPAGWQTLQIHMGGEAFLLFIPPSTFPAPSPLFPKDREQFVLLVPNVDGDIVFILQKDLIPQVTQLSWLGGG